MRLRLLILFFFSAICTSFSQVDFKAAYDAKPFVPKGILEAVAWTNTHMVHLQNQQESCSGIPQPYGIMGLHDDGKNYFNKNGVLVASYSGISILQQKSSPDLQVLAYAETFNALMIENGASSSGDIVAIRETLLDLSEIPDSGVVNLLARDMQVYSIMKFMRSSTKGMQYGFTPHHFDLASVFGTANFSVLSSKKIQFTENGIKGDQGLSYAPSETKSTEYGPAIWDPAPVCNFSSRNGVAVSAITIHTIQGSYAGAISWAQNCASGVSYHYVIRSSDGQITQMVSEADKAWHVGSENPYTIGYEHEGYVNDPSWYTEEMYNSSADLSRDIVNSGYGIPPLRTYYGASSAGVQVLGGCTKIKGHQHYPNQTHTDPGINWDWEKYYRLINNAPVINTITSTSGSFYDTGGAGGNYQDDERELWLIQPANASSITIDFTSFDLESGYDNLFIYDGDTIGAPLIGSYTGTNSPGSITSSGGSLLIEFRSDCGTTAQGWEANYTSLLSDTIPPAISIVANPGWKTEDFTAQFTDTDSQSGVAERYYNVSSKLYLANTPGADGAFGFIRDEFEGTGATWTSLIGSHTTIFSAYHQGDTAEQNSNSYTDVVLDNTHSYLFEWTQIIHPHNGNERAGMHFFCDDPTLPNRGNSYFVYLRGSDKVQIYRVTNDVYSLEVDTDFTIDMPEYYNVQVTYNPTTGLINVYINGSFVSSWQDPNPLQSGNSISLRSGGCSVFFDDIHVYKSRGNSELISVGINSEFDLESDYGVEAGFIKSIAIDSAKNISPAIEQEHLVDLTKPVLVELNDGVSNDIDTFYTTTLEANWSMEDLQSNISEYEVAVGTLPSLDNIVPWTSNGLSEVFSTVLSPTPNYNEVFHVSVRAINGAGLDEVFVSDGQLYNGDLSIAEDALNEITMYPNPADQHQLVYLKNVPKGIQITVVDMFGKICSANYSDGTINVSKLSTGTYSVILRLNQSFVIKKLIIQ